jgi:hypothetical protein
VDKYCRAGQVTDDNIIRSRGISYWVKYAKYTQSEYVTLRFSTEKWLRERASMLRLYAHAFIVPYVIRLIENRLQIGQITLLMISKYLFDCFSGFIKDV